MTEPFVCCITPTRDRPEYLKRAVECFRAHTYTRRMLLIYDDGSDPVTHVSHDPDPLILHVRSFALIGKHSPIGTLRNHAIALETKADLIAHFDDDDWSAPTRLAEQVAFMQASGTEIVGYSDMPFYDEIRDKVLLYDSHNPNYALGTSLMYTRAIWERVPFPDQNDEDTTWQNLVGPANVRSVSSVEGGVKMFATIHKGNTSPKQGARFQAASPELDSAVRNLLNISSGQASRTPESTSVLSQVR
jgi:glycosyltransferase involved in cell wall biosynthesis